MFVSAILEFTELLIFITKCSKDFLILLIQSEILESLVLPTFHRNYRSCFRDFRKISIDVWRTLIFHQIEGAYFLSPSPKPRLCSVILEIKFFYHIDVCFFTSHLKTTFNDGLPKSVG